jgi:hypothetical protein
MPSLGEADESARVIREADEAERQFREKGLEGFSHGRMDLAEPRKERAIDPESGPRHYEAASRYARRAAKALDREEVTRAQALAAIGQIHATLAVAAATVLHEE